MSLGRIGRLYKLPRDSFIVKGRVGRLYPLELLKFRVDERVWEMLIHGHKDKD
jgi:hypothetical protein